MLLGARVVKSRHKLSEENVGSQRLSGSEFQSIRPAMEKTSSPNMERQLVADEQTADADNGKCWRLGCRIASSTVKLCAADTGEQLCIVNE